MLGSCPLLLGQTAMLSQASVSRKAPGAGVLVGGRGLELAGASLAETLMPF
jgi:hypothetical protein